MLLILVMFSYENCYNWGNLVRTDRDDALTIASQRFEAGKNPYDTLTAINNVLTTGTSSILYGQILSERNLSFFFWLWFIAIIYKGNNFVLYALFMIIGFTFFARTMLYRLEELYYGMIPMYYAFRYNNGYLMALAMTNRIAYWFYGLILILKKPKAAVGMGIGIVIISLIISPEDFIRNNFIMLHIPSYPLDYSLLFIIPVMLLFNDRKIGLDLILHNVAVKGLGYIRKEGDLYYRTQCVYCGEITEVKIEN